MDKLTLKELKLKKEGVQIKNALKEKYGDLEGFAQDVGLYPDSLYQYLRSSCCPSDKFKVKLVTALQKDYHEIVLSIEAQLKHMVDKVTANIKAYDTEEDFEVLEKLRNMCMRKKQNLLSAIMMRNVGMYHFYKGNSHDAVDMLSMAASMIEDDYKDELRFQFLSELGLIYYYQENYKRGKTVFEECERIAERTELDNEQLFLMYYRHGILLNNMKKSNIAIEKFLLAIKYSTTNFYKGKATMNLGIAYKKCDNYEVAESYYNQAIKIFDNTDNKSIGIVYINLSEMYKVKKDYDKALSYSLNAIEYLKGIDSYFHLVALATLTEIKILRHEAEGAADDLIDAIERLCDSFVYRKYIFEAINIVKNYAMKKSNIELLKKIYQAMTIELNKSKDNSYKEGIKALLYDILVFLNNGGVLIEKVN